MVRIKKAIPSGGFVVRLEFTDGTEKTLDLEPYLRGPVFEEARRDPSVFRSLTVDPLLGTIVWPNGADIAPEVLRYGRTPAAWEPAPVQPR